MPVDLSCIPARAKRRAPPSLKRWLMFLIVLIAIGGFVTAYLWPDGVPTHTAVFWLCFLGIPWVCGSTVFAIRWLVYLAGEWPADGWDAAREQDLAQDIQNGQRSLAMLACIAHLPHVISAESISQQLLMPEGITLPSLVDENGELISHHASFGDAALSLQERVKEQVRMLLTEVTLQSAFQRLPRNASLTVMFQFGRDIVFSPEEHREIQQSTEERVGFPFNINFIDGEGLRAVDTWLDSPEMMQNLLVIALNISEMKNDGTGEAAVALLMNLPDRAELSQSVVAEIHRPVQTLDAQGLNTALFQAMHWGMTTTETIKQIWLTGTGTSNEASSLLSTAGLRFPAAGQPCDIDLKTGLTGLVSPWLAMAVAADQAAQSGSPQLVMCVSDEKALPWFMTVCPAAE